jgi:FHS family L-fucose permease-like MFS transporter
MQAESPALVMPSRKGLSSPMVIIGILFFVFGFVTWLGSVLIPYLQIACQLSNTGSMLVAFAFYISYFIMAIPSSLVLKRTGYKNGISLGLYIMAAGSLIFVPAALTREYYLFLTGLFVQGTGLAILQTAANPYVTILGPRESAAKRISIMGICNGIAASTAPILLGAVTLKDADGIREKAKHLQGIQLTTLLDTMAHRAILPYVMMMVVLFLLAIWVRFSGLPEMDKDPEEDVVPETEPAEGAHISPAPGIRKTSVFQFPHLVLGVFTLFLYVGVEVISGDTIINYGSFQGIPLSTSKFFTSCTMINMLIGYIIGVIAIPKYLSQEKALRYSSVVGIVFALIALFTNGVLSVVFVSLLGLANALIWPSIWPLALEGLGKFTKTASSLLIMAIGGGAILPLLYGWLAYKFDRHEAYWMVIPCYLAILFYAYKGHKIRTG